MFRSIQRAGCYIAWSEIYLQIIFASPPAPGNAKIRFINLSPDSNPIQLKIKDVALPLTVGQSFTDASSFMDIEGKAYHFEIVSGGVVVDEIPNAQLQSGWFYNIIVWGFAIHRPVTPTPSTLSTN